jgi:hypothetical protein
LLLQQKTQEFAFPEEINGVAEVFKGGNKGV